jgi:hypothetical protein
VDPARLRASEAEVAEVDAVDAAADLRATRPLLIQESVVVVAISAAVAEEAEEAEAPSV